MHLADQLWDSVAVMLAPDGTPVVGGDDFFKYFAGFDWVAPATATYRLRLTSFENINTGPSPSRAGDVGVFGYLLTSNRVVTSSNPRSPARARCASTSRRMRAIASR